MSAERGARSVERGTRNSELGTRNSELGARNAECGARSGEWGVGSSERGVRNGELGTRNSERGERSSEGGKWSVEGIGQPHRSKLPRFVFSEISSYSSTVNLEPAPTRNKINFKQFSFLTGSILIQFWFLSARTDYVSIEETHLSKSLVGSV